MPKYAVFFSGVAYVEADDQETAKEAFHDDDFVLKDTEVTSINEVDEFVMRL